MNIILGYKIKVRKLIFYILSLILILVSGCDCSCDTVPHVDTNNASVERSTVTVFADGCSDSSGEVNSDGIPLGDCDGSGSQYSNRGRWVSDTKVKASPGSQLTISVFGSMYFCSSGYDNKNLSPEIEVLPGKGIQTIFNNGLAMPVDYGQIIVFEVIDSGNGVGIDVNAQELSSLSYCTDDQYNDFSMGRCKADKGYGLTIYIDDKEIVTLDNLDLPDSEYSYDEKRFRYPDLFSPYLDSSYPDTEIITLNDYYTDVSRKYNKDMSSQGPGKYVFKVPSNVSGVIGFSIAQANGTSGSGSYTLRTLTTPHACFVNEAQASGQSGERGALQVLISEANPNDTDNVLAAFDAYDSDLSEYYPELVNYINSKVGVSINSDADVLEELKVSSTPGLTPMILTEPGYSGTSSDGGPLWFKVRDDYYHDNVGQYTVVTSVTTKKDSKVSSFMQSLIDPLVESLDSATRIIYNNFIVDKRFLNIVKMSLLLYLMVYGAEFMLGLTSVSANDLLVRMIKVAVVIELFDPDHWAFFNDYLFNLFTNGSDYVVAAVTGDATTYKTGIFGFVDDVFNIFFAEDTWKRLAALLPTIIGVLYFIVFVYVMIVYLVILTKVFISYLLILMGIALLIALGPLFIVMILFERTRVFFNNWIKYMADYALQPVLLFATLYVMNSIFMVLWDNATNFDICYGGMIDLTFREVEIHTYNIIPRFSLGCIWGFKILGGLDVFGMMLTILALVFLVKAMEELMDQIPEFTTAITGATGSADNVDSVSSAIQHDLSTPVRYTKSAAKYVVNAIEEHRGRKGGGKVPSSKGGSGSISGASINSIEYKLRKN